jgi:hypothetical protein
MVSHLIEILGPVVQREEKEANAKRVEMSNLASTFAKSEKRIHKESVPSVPEQAEPIRTMAEDMNRVHGYGAYREQERESETRGAHNSSQEELLHKKPETPLS